LQTVKRLVDRPEFTDVTAEIAKTAVNPADWIARIGLKSISSR